MALVLDTGPLFGAMDQRDQDFARCSALISGSRETLVIPAPVLVEVDQLVHARLQPPVFEALLRDIAIGVLRVEPLTLDDYIRINEICIQYRDSNIGFVDAAVLAVVERLNEPKLATLDHRHFGMLRPRHVAALKLVPEL